MYLLPFGCRKWGLIKNELKFIIYNQYTLFLSLFLSLFRVHCLVFFFSSFIDFYRTGNIYVQAYNHDNRFVDVIYSLFCCCCCGWAVLLGEPRGSSSMMVTCYSCLVGGLNRPDRFSLFLEKEMDIYPSIFPLIYGY